MLPAITLAVACFAFSTPVHAAQTAPYKINFQGRLTNASSTTLSGTYDMQFKLYTALTGGTLVWSETRTAANSNAVTVTNGLFSILIGEGTAVAGSSATLQAAITANTTLYMEVMVGTETLSPRSQFGSSAYAINSDMLDGYDSSYFAPATGSTAYAPITGSTAYAPITGSTAYAPLSGSTNYAPISGSANYIQNGTSAQSASFNVSGSGTIGGAGTVTGAFTNNGAATFYNSTNSTSAFTIQTSGSAKLFVVDTTNSLVYIGDSTPNNSAVLLVLDNKNTTGDPSAVEGGMYYNSANRSFRCGVAGSWQSCSGLLYTNTAVGSAVNTCTTACGPVATAPIPANLCQAGRVLTIKASGVLSDTTTAPTLSWGFYYGTSTTKSSDTLLGVASPTGNLTATSMSGVPWKIDATIVCFSTTSMNLTGTVTTQINSTAATTNLMNSFTPTTTNGLTTTTAKNLYLFPAFSASNASNSVTMNQFVVTVQ